MSVAPNEDLVPHLATTNRGRISWAVAVRIIKERTVVLGTVVLSAALSERGLLIEDIPLSGFER